MSKENTKVVNANVEEEKKDKQDIVLINEETIQNKIYVIRGQKVMLDFELAEIYGYTTKRFNEQVKNNIERFDEDFRFQLTKNEWDDLRSKKSTSSWGGSRYLPYAFTEQGIYMLMTVLKGELAVNQSKALIRTFKVMKDYIVENQGIILFSDNVGKGLHSTEFNDFVKQYPNCKVELRQTGKKYHDCYIVIDYGTEQEKIFHCGPSSKDGGMRIGSIVEIREREAYHTLVDELCEMPLLELA